MSAIFDHATVFQVQQANDIVDVIGEHVSLTKKGKEMVGLCPFHDDHRPSLCVSSTKQIFKCFACGAGGDVLKFVQMRENLTFPQAIERLAERVGIKIRPVEKAKLAGADQSAVDPNRLAKVNEWAAGHFEANLYSTGAGKDALGYIAGRSIGIDVAKQWRIGLAGNSGDDLVVAARERKIPLELLQHAGLALGKGSAFVDKFVGRLMFPIIDVTGRVIGFGGRTLDGEGAKYVNSPATILFDKSNSLYGLVHARHRIVSGQTAIVVEGYTDCIMAHSKGCSNVVATLGTSFTSGHARILRRYAKQVVLVFDSDEAGVEAANRALEVCLVARVDIKLASVPAGKDPCDFLVAAGRDGFEKLVSEAVDVFQFKWDRLVKSFDSDNTLSGRRVAVEEFLQTVANGLWAGRVSAIERGLLVNRLSGIVGADVKDINSELGRIMGRQSSRVSVSMVENQKVVSVDFGKGLFAIAQREILEVLLNEPKLFKAIGHSITCDTFDVPVLRQIAEILFEVMGAGLDISLPLLLAKTESVEVGSALVELARAGQEKGNFSQRLNGALGVMQQLSGCRRRREIKAIKGEKQFLQYLSKNARKDNPHSVGMT